MHNYLPNQSVKIITVQIAVPSDAEPGDVADEVLALLSENGVANPDSNILDWQYGLDRGYVMTTPQVTLGDDPEEGDALILLDELQATKL